MKADVLFITAAEKTVNSVSSHQLPLPTAVKEVCDILNTGIYYFEAASHEDCLSFEAFVNSSA